MVRKRFRWSRACGWWTELLSGQVDLFIPRMRSRFLLRWASASPAVGADLETADGEILRVLVADGRGSDGTQLFA